MRWTACFIFILLLPAASADEPMTLSQFLIEVRGRNLELKAQSALADAATAAANGLVIPAPMIGLTQMQDESGRATNLEVSQTIPFPTRLSNNRDARKFEAEARGSAKEAREAEILAEAKLRYFKIWKAQERISLLREKKSAIERHLKLARAASRSDTFLKIHLIKVESELDLLENEILQAVQERRERQIEAAEFLNQDPTSFKLTANEVPLSVLPEENSLENPKQLEVSRYELEILKSKEGEARSSWFPEFNLRYREMGGTQMTPKSSEIMVGATLPFIFFWQPNAVTSKASAERLQSEFLLTQERRRIESRCATLRAKAVSLKMQLDQFRQSLLPRAEKRMRLVQNLAPRDSEILQDHRESMEAFPELKLKALDVRERYEEAVAELEKYISGEKK